MNSILVVKLSAIGDVIHALPVSYALKETYPEAKVTWVVESPAYDILRDNPYIDEILIFEKKKFKTLGGFLSNFGPFKAKLQAKKYDAAMDLQGLFKSASIAYLSNAPVRLGTCNMREMSDKISQPVVGPNANGHIVERYLDVARALGCQVDKVVFPMVISDKDASIAQRIMEQSGARKANSYVVFAVGANWPNKRWSAKSFAELGDWLYDKGIVPVIIGGGTVDEQTAREIESYTEIPPINLVGKTSLKQLAYVIQNSLAVVGGDTGPVHLSAGLGVKTVMLMGPTDANRNGPYGQLENAIEADHPCKYCWKRACPKGEDCLAKISVEQVKEKLEKIGIPHREPLR